jgi:hypothetical protein
MAQAHRTVHLVPCLRIGKPTKWVTWGLFRYIIESLTVDNSGQSKEYHTRYTPTIYVSN